MPEDERPMAPVTNWGAEAEGIAKRAGVTVTQYQRSEAPPPPPAGPDDDELMDDELTGDPENDETMYIGRIDGLPGRKIFWSEERATDWLGSPTATRARRLWAFSLISGRELQIVPARLAPVRTNPVRKRRPGPTPPSPYVA